MFRILFIRFIYRMENVLKRKIIVLFLMFIIIFTECVCAIPVRMADTSSLPKSPEVFAESAILLDVDSDKILYEKNADKVMYPASTTKLMTALLALEKCDDLSAKALVSYYAVHEVPYSYSIADLVPGEELSINDLLHALLIPSANDAAYVLAEYLANNGNSYSSSEGEVNKAKFENSLELFSNMMNEKAKSLGCKHTHFVNPNGIHSDSHVSSAYDLMLIGKEAYRNETLRSICGKTHYSLPNTTLYTGDTRTVTTTNILISEDRDDYYEYANGLKTGYTELAQSCIVASAHKGDRNLIAVILHSDTESTDDNQSRENDCKRLFEYGFNSFSNSTLMAKDSIVQSIELWNGTNETRHVNALCKDDLHTLVVNGDVLDVTPEIMIDVKSAPVSTGETIGSITYNINGELFVSELIADHDVVPIDLQPFWLGGLIVIILLIIILLKKKKKRRR